MSENKEKSWKEIPRGGLILEAGNAKDYLTGGWRSKKPVWMSDKCIHCMTCWICCPDASIKVENEKVVGIDYDHCKGCGICASVCPVKDKAIRMVREDEKNE